MRRKTIIRCLQYLAMIAVMGIAIFCILAGICCMRLEEYRQQDRNRESALESSARWHAGEILEIYLSQGMKQADAYAGAENVYYNMQKASGRYLGGNYNSYGATPILQMDGKTLEYCYHLPEDSQENAGYFIKIAYLELEQILKVPIPLEGLPDDLRTWAQGFWVAAGVSLALTMTMLGTMIQNVGRVRRESVMRKRKIKTFIELFFWCAATVAVGLWGYRLPRIWSIPITWKEGAEPMKALLGQSIRDMTVCGLLLGNLATGFLLYLFRRRKTDQITENSLFQKVLGKPARALKKLSWFQKALFILLSVCTLEALLMGLAQYKVMHGEKMDGLKEWLTACGGGWLVWGLWILEKIILSSLVLRTAGGMLRLRTSGRELAQGNLGYQIPLKGMRGEALQFGRDLNAISQVVADAVEDRMRSERLKTELITNVSHDIKTPLTSIINYADLIGREQTDNEKIAEYAEVLHRQSARLKKLIEDLMEVSRASTGNLEVFLERCQAGVLLSQAMGEFEHRLEERGLELIVRQSQEPVWIMADPRMLWRILDNLMTNICKYAQSNTRVYLSLETTDGKAGEEQAVLIFKNISGHPLEMDASELMERFVRGDKSRHTEGNGLGLAIARSLTELQGGTMQLTTDGDLFKVMLTFPVAGETKQDL